MSWYPSSRGTNQSAWLLISSGCGYNNSWYVLARNLVNFRHSIGILIDSWIGASCNLQLRAQVVQFIAYTIPCAEICSQLLNAVCGGTRRPQSNHSLSFPKRSSTIVIYVSHGRKKFATYNLLAKVATCTAETFWQNINVAAEVCKIVVKGTSGLTGNFAFYYI